MAKRRQHHLIRSKAEWDRLLERTTNLKNKVIQNVDFTDGTVDWNALKLRGTTFLGCDFRKKDAYYIISRGAFVYPKFTKLPFNAHRTRLYNWQELMRGYDSEEGETRDWKIYKHFMKHKYNPPVGEAMAERIHDYGIDMALRNVLKFNDEGMTKRRVVSFMGGHSVRRGSEYFIKVALIAQKLAAKGYFIATGGGPGIMEAGNLGAYFGNYSEADLLDAIDILTELKYKEKGQRDFHVENYMELSLKVLEKYPDGKENLAIPTWFYGHEPTNLFATYIAKYFSNSIREDTLLSVSLYGIVYAPGSAGTTQEIFQAAAQNHYGTFGYYSPMVFLGKKRYVEDTSLYSVLHQLAVGRKYKKMLYLTDDPDLVVEFIEEHPPRAVGNNSRY